MLDFKPRTIELLNEIMKPDEEELMTQPTEAIRHRFLVSLLFIILKRLDEIEDKIK